MRGKGWQPTFSQCVGVVIVQGVHQGAPQRSLCAAGNGPIEMTSVNALRVLEKVGAKDVPVARGAEMATT